MLLAERTSLLERAYLLRILVTLFFYPWSLAWSLIHGLRSWWRAIWARPVSQREFVGEVAVVTGAGRGLGRYIAISLAERGCHVAVVDIQGKLAEETAAFLCDVYRVKAKAYKIDVTDYDQLLDLRARVTCDLGDVTILVNNAALLTLPLENPSPQEIQRMINVNLTAIVYTTQIFLPKMKELDHGWVVNISSIWALLPNCVFSVYAATKAAVRSLTSSLRVELKQVESNVRAITVFPSYLKTHKRMYELVKLTQSQYLLPPTDGLVAAEQVIKAMRNGDDDEVTIPRNLYLFCALYRSLSTYVREQFYLLATAYPFAVFSVAPSTEILAESDIVYD